MRYLTVGKFSSESGYTEAAVRSKIRDGVWLKNQVWRKAPDGRILIDVDGYSSWVEDSEPSTQPRAHILVTHHKSSKSLSPPPLVK